MTIFFLWAISILAHPITYIKFLWLSFKSRNKNGKSNAE